MNRAEPKASLYHTTQTKILVYFYSYFHSKIDSLFAKSRILKVKLELESLRKNIHFCVFESLPHKTPLPTESQQESYTEITRHLSRLYSYFHSKIDSLFAKSRILKLKWKLKTLRKNIHFCFR